MAQKARIEEYADGNVTIYNLRNNLGVPVFGLNEMISASRVTQYWDGTPMDDSKVDNQLYIQLKRLPDDSKPQLDKYIGNYFRVNLPYSGELFLEKDTMSEVRGLSPTDLLLIKSGYYKGIKLNGYYQKGDTPSPIEYVVSSEDLIDNGGNIVVIDDVVLFSDLQQETNIKYFGARSIDGFDNKEAINNALLAAKRVFIDDGDWWVSVSSGGYGTGGIVLQNGSDLILSKNAVIKQISGSLSIGNLLGVNNKSNIKVSGGKWVGDKYSHLTPDGTYWKERKNSTPYSVGEYIYENGWGFRVESSGVSGVSVPTLNSSILVGDVISDGSLSLLVVNSYLTSSLGERMHGFWINNSKNIKISDTDFVEFWGDGLYIGGASSAVYRGGEDVLCDNLKCDDNRRQGASIVQAERVTFRFCEFTNTSGTNPRAGVDVEPNDPTHWVKDLTFDTCHFDYNEGSGLELAVHNPGPFIDGVIINNCFLNGNRFDSVGYDYNDPNAKYDSVRNVKVYHTFVNVSNRDNAVRFRRTSNFDLVGVSCTKPEVNERDVFGLHITDNCSNFNVIDCGFKGFPNISVRIDTGASNWMFRGNTAEDGVNFLYASESQNFIISTNTGNNLTNRGVWIANSSEGLVVNNSYKNMGSGSNIVLDNGTTDVTVKTNFCINPRVQGVLVVGNSYRNLVVDNTIISYGNTQRGVVTSGVTGVGGNIVGLNNFIGTFTAGNQQHSPTTIMFPQIQQQNGVLSFQDGGSADITRILTESKPDGLSIDSRAVVRPIRAVSPSSVNYPAAAGGGIYYQRNDSTGMGSFTLFKGNTNDLDFYLQTSTGKSAPFQFILSGDSLSRPSGVERYVGSIYFDTDLGINICWNGTEWTDLMGNSLEPDTDPEVEGSEE